MGAAMRWPGQLSRPTSQPASALLCTAPRHASGSCCSRAAWLPRPAAAWPHCRQRHHGTAGAPSVVRLQIAPADVAGIDTIETVGGGERRNLRPIAVMAVRTGQRLELPAQRASSADQMPVRRRRDDGEVRLAAAQRAVRVASRRSGPCAAAALRRSATGTVASPASAPG